MPKVTNRKHHLTAETTKDRAIKFQAFMVGLMLEEWDTYTAPAFLIQAGPIISVVCSLKTKCKTKVWDSFFSS